MALRESDEQLVKTYQRAPGSRAGRAAVEELFSRWEDRLYAWCRRHVRNSEVALDMAQDAMLAAYRALPSFEGRCRFSSWLFGIARNRCLREIDRSRRWSDEEIDPDQQVDASPLPEHTLETRDELVKLLELCENRLDERERMAMWLRCEEDMGVDEITKVLGLDSASGARGLLQTARRKLRAALRERDPGTAGAEGATE